MLFVINQKVYSSKLNNNNHNMKQLVITFVVLFSMAAFSQKIEKDLGEFSQLKTFDGLSVQLVKSNENKVVIAPEQWFSNKEQDYSNVIPKSWIKL